MGAHHRSGHVRKRSDYRGRGRHRAKAQHSWLVPLTATTMSISLMVPVTAHASTLISIGATGSWTDTPVTGLQKWPATNIFAGDPVTATEVVEYPASLGFVGMSMEDSVLEGVAALRKAIESISGRKIVACESQGCLSVTRLLMQFAAEPTTAPSHEDLIIVMIGNPATAGGGVSAQSPGEYEPFLRITFPGATPETQFETVNVTREYDFFADRPDGDPTVLSVLNTMVAFLVVHPFYADVDMDDPENLIKVVGNTTYVLIPTKQLPVLQSLYDAAHAWQRLTGRTTLLEDVEALDARLRAIIDQGYDRSGFVPQGPVPQEQPEGAADEPAEPESQPADDPAPDDGTTPAASDDDATASITEDSEAIEDTNSTEPEQETETADVAEASRPVDELSTETDNDDENENDDSEHSLGADSGSTEPNESEPDPSPSSSDTGPASDSSNASGSSDAEPDSRPASI